MSNGVFLLVLVAFGFVVLVYFHRRAKNYQERHPGKENPIKEWMTGEDEKDDSDKSS
jgi:hypothetical protein